MDLATAPAKAPARARRFALVSGDFVVTGGMDRANYALAAHLARREGAEVHLVTHRAAPDLEASPAVVVHRVPKPLNSYMLGAPLIQRMGRRLASRLAAEGARVVVNGGNCFFGDVNWVHHVHASDPHDPKGGPLNRLKGRINYRNWLREERKAIEMARLVVTTCERNRRDLVERLGVDDRRIRTAYYGIDADVFRPADDAERAGLRSRLGLPADRPLVAFVGALGDRRKGFDTLFEAWKLLCAAPRGRPTSWSSARGPSCRAGGRSRGSRPRSPAGSISWASGATRPTSFARATPTASRRDTRDIRS